MLAGRIKTCHANMLKKYWSREHEEMNEVVIEPEEREEDEMNLFKAKCIKMSRLIQNYRTER